jgi:serine protease AprX
MKQTQCHFASRKKAVWGPKRIAAALLVTLACSAPYTAAADTGSSDGANSPGASVKAYKLDGELTKRANGRLLLSKTRVIVTMQPGAALPAAFKAYARGGKLTLVNGQVLELPNGLLKQLAAHPNVYRMHYDRPTATHNYRTGVTVGARIVNHYGLKGNGIGIAVLDSGMATFHDDMMNNTSKLYPYGNQRVAKFVDFVNGRTTPYDDNGHGTHVTGTIAGNGYDSKGEKAGLAPNASIVSLKVLDQFGQGTVSRIIDALGWVAANATTYNIRVVNLSVGAGVYESYWTDPLTLAAKKLTDRGITVVAAAGNLGRNFAGQLQWGGITAPANAPWVLTVGASSTMGTDTGADDTMASFSSSGPTHIDHAAKPDLVAPGTGTASLAAAGSYLYFTKAAFLLSGKRITATKPYLALSGTSMAAPVVSGTIALMLEANPDLTPNLIKAILQYTAHRSPNYSALRQGAGYLDSLGAVWLAYFQKTAKAGDVYPYLPTWSRAINWGNHQVKGGIITPTANAWANGVVWGSARLQSVDAVSGTMVDGDNVVWGTMAADGDNVVWGTAMADGDNVVWGTSFDGDNVVWGTMADGDNVVWGTDCGGADCDNVTWGTMSLDGDNVVWGTAMDGDNVVWGTSMSIDGDNVVWGTSTDHSISWATADVEDVIFNDDPVTGELAPDVGFDFGGVVEEPLPSIELDFGEVLTPLTTTVIDSVLLGGL